MNGRVNAEETPEGRLAAVARSLALRMAEEHEQTGSGPAEPDYADYREALRPFVLRELILARIEEARTVCSASVTARMRELTVELREAQEQIPEAYRI